MAELKHTFTSGRMNKDLDDRLVPNGEYTDALNIQISSSEGDDVGSIENTLGNELLSDLQLQNAKTLGSISDTKKDKIYWIVTSDSIDAIYEFDEKTKEIKPVLLDEKTNQTITINDVSIYSNVEGELSFSYNELKFNSLLGKNLEKATPDSPQKYGLTHSNVDIECSEIDLKITAPKNTSVLNNNNESIEFKNIPYNGKHFGNLDVNFTYTDSGFLNFSKNNLITGINIIDGLLFWTDNINQPRRINISEFKNYKHIANQTQISYKYKDSNGTVNIDYRPINEDDISVIKKAPLKAPNITLFDTDITGNTTITAQVNFVDKIAGDEIDITDFGGIPNWVEGQSILFVTEDADLSLECRVQSIDATNKSIKVIISNIDSDEPVTKSHLFTANLVEEDPIYELAFVRFAYRWKYKNGEYSVFSPFTQPAFYPNFKVNRNGFKYDGKEAFNYGMVNQVRKVLLEDFDLGSDEVEDIEIIFKETRNNNIYILTTKKRLNFENSFTIRKEQIKSLVANDQLLRQWDNVPRKAKAQEVTANRVIYGNYIQNYDVFEDPDFDVKLNTANAERRISAKSNRNYQLGVVYSDEYNRQTPVFSNDTGVITIPKSKSSEQNRISASIKTPPPPWATHYRYFIKDTSGEFYNLAADRFYNDVENGFMYISFPSSERNKVTEEHYLLLKKNHGDNNPVDSTENRYKIIDISAEPPEFITARKRLVRSLGNIVFTDDYKGSGGGTTITNKDDASNAAPLNERAIIQLKQANGSPDGVELEETKEIKPGRYINFEYLGKESKPYKIKRLSQDPAGSNEIKIDFEEPFGEDVEIIYNKTSGNLGDQNTNLGVSMNILEEFIAAGDKEFDGRFFVKLKSNSTLINSIITQDIGGVSYLVKFDLNLIGIYSSKDSNGTGRSGSNKWRNVNRGKDSAATNPRNDFVVHKGGTAIPGSTYETGKRHDAGSIEYNISVEASTRRRNSEVEKLQKLAKVGNFVRFVNPDGTPHHDKIYEIGQTLRTTHETKHGGNYFTKFRTYVELHFRFVDEDGNFQPLLKDIVTRGDDTWMNEPRMEILEERVEENLVVKEPAIFETEPLESKTELNIYFEASDILPISIHGDNYNLNWYNCISFGNGVESNRIRDDYNAVFIDNGVKASTVLDEPFKEEHKFNSLIWSGIVNSRSGVNRSNEFNMANPITKDFLPSYGSIQKLHGWDDSMVIICEDKTLRVLANKSALYNANGSSNLISDSRVIGDPIEYNGEYGIGTYPESFASHGFRCYFADKTRGVIIRLSKDGLTPISKNYMNSFFRQRLFAANTFYGSYDARKKLYNISFDGLDTVCFSEDVNGWVTRASFIPENALYLNNIYYTYRNGDLWQHDSPNVVRNNYYGAQYKSHVEFIINDNPSVIKKYKTLGYEGTAGWIAKNIVTDQVTGTEATFTPKENKFFTNITQEAKKTNNLDHKNFSTQGIGRSIRKPNEVDYDDTVGAQDLDDFNVKINDGQSWSSDIKQSIEIKQDGSIDDIQITLFPTSGYLIEKAQFTTPNSLITVENSTPNVIVTVKGDYLESLNPSDNDTKYITLAGKSVLQPIKVSGSYSIQGPFVTDDIGNGNYQITEDPNTVQQINKRIIKPLNGYYINVEDITIDNSLISISKNKLGNGNIEVIETITIPRAKSTNINYTISAVAHEIIIPDKVIFTKNLNTSDVNNDGETRTLILNGEKNSEYELVFLEGSSVIKSVSGKIPSNTLKSNVDLIFPAGDTAQTYTVQLKTVSGTVFSNTFGDETINIYRKVRYVNDITFTVDVGSNITTTQSLTNSPVIVSGYVDDIADIDFTFSYTLNGTGYSLSKVPVMDDVVFSTNNTGTKIIFNTFTLTTATNDTLLIKGKLTSTSFIDSEFFELNLNNLLDKNVTITFAYSNTIAGGSATSNYTVAGYNGASIPYTITTKANKPHTNMIGRYFELTSASGYKNKKTFTNIIPFKIYDSSNNDVTATFAFNEKVSFGPRPSVNNSKIVVGFKNKTFVAPSTNQTYTIRPLEEIFEANTGVEIRALIAFATQLKSSGFTKINGYSSVAAYNMTINTVSTGQNFESGSINQRSLDNIDRALSGEGVTQRWLGSNGNEQFFNGNGLQGITNSFSETSSGRYWITDGSAGNKLMQHVMKMPDSLFYWWDPDNTSTSKYNITNLGSYFTKATAGTYTDIFGDSKQVTNTFEVSADGKTLTVNMLINFNNTPVGNTYYIPELLVTAVNDHPGFFNKYLAKVGNYDHYKDPCTLVHDDNIDFVEVISKDLPLKKGSLVYLRTNDGDLLYLGNRFPAYIKDNPNLLYSDENKFLNAGAKSVPKGHYNFIQGEAPITLEDTNCSIVKFNDFPTVKKTGELGYIKSVTSNNGGIYQYKEIYLKNTAYANKEITIKGTYFDMRYANYSNIPNNNVSNNAFNKNLMIVTSPSYPKGIYAQKAIEHVETFGWKITDPALNTWEAKVQLDSKGEGTLQIGVQIYSNVNVNGLIVYSEQITGPNGETLASHGDAYYDLTRMRIGSSAKKPEPKYEIDYSVKQFVFKGNYKPYTDHPENADFPSLYNIDSNGTIVESDQWVNYYTGQMFLPTKNQ